MRQVLVTVLVATLCGGCNALAGIDAVTEDPCALGCGETAASGGSATGGNGGSISASGGAGGEAGGSGGTVTDQLLWSGVYGDDNNQVLYDLVVDKDGAVIFTGELVGLMSFGGGSINAGDGDPGNAYLVKLDAQGNWVWSDTYGDGDDQEGHRVAVADNGDVVVATVFQGTISFGGTEHTDDARQVALAKVSSTGSYLWSAATTGTGLHVIGGLAMDGDSAIVTGSFTDDIDFGGGALTTESNSAAFVVKRKPNGDPDWSKSFDGVQEVAGVVVHSSGNITIAGWFSGTANFGGSDLQAGTGESVFMAQFDSLGVHVWSKGFGDGVNKHQIKSVAPAGEGCLVGGRLNGAVDFGGGVLSAGGVAFDAFVASFNSSGAHEWSDIFAGAGNKSVDAVAADADGNVLIAGAFTAEIDLGDGPQPTISNAVASAFIGKFDADRTLTSTRIYGHGAVDEITLGVSPSNNVTFGATLFGAIDFGTGPAGTGADLGVTLATFNY